MCGIGEAAPAIEHPVHQCHEWHQHGEQRRYCLVIASLVRCCNWPIPPRQILARAFTRSRSQSRAGDCRAHRPASCSARRFASVVAITAFAS